MAGLGWASVTAGGGQTGAIRTDGTLWCWGDNSYGELGLGPTADQSLPQQVSTPAQPGWAVVSAGAAHTCAIRAGHPLWCWGTTATASAPAPPAHSSTVVSFPPGWRFDA